MKAYYNEHDKQAAAWLRELIRQKVITDGVVDERSIEDVIPAELAEFDRCHFFAGIGVWDYALNQTEWGREPVWTGSAPCQPFSAAGKGDGFADERHLWPSWFHLIEQLRPITIFGEQVFSKDGYDWLDLVQDDLEGTGYAVRPLGIPACSVGAPHRRNRLYFVADTEHKGRNNRRGDEGRRSNHDNGRDAETGSDRDLGRLCSDACTDSDSSNLALANGGNPCTERLQRSGEYGQLPQNGRALQLGNTIGPGLERLAGDEHDRDESRRLRADEIRSASETGPTNGFWRDAEWIYCRDEKYRAVEPGTFPLAPRTAGRVGLIRGYGNSIVAPLAIEFIKAYLETKG